MEPSLNITFANGHTAPAAYLNQIADITAALEALRLVQARPVLVLVGGAGKLSPDDQQRVRSLFVQVLAPLAEAMQAVVVDGGTDSGVMSMMGCARTQLKATFPLVGIAATGTVALPQQPLPHSDAAYLEPHHTHFMLVPGSRWGDESLWIAQIASAIAQDQPSVTVLINGGEVTWSDAANNLDQHRPLVVIAGSGRTADAIAKAIQGNITDERAHYILASGLMQVIDLHCSKDLSELIHSILSTPTPLNLGSAVSDT
ncbi:hypothetical protein ACQ4M4_10180 [Leptolyngbya sp. AN02str]|uniref:hypothetical protein n=1 Tax=Leptolyngbya sp. AN02str TaxID=3423363 RepID=UPI003D323792